MVDRHSCTGLKKIVLVISSLRFGGSERVMSDLANYWAKQGHLVTLVTLEKQFEYEYSLRPEVNLYRICIPSGKNRLKNLHIKKVNY